MHNPLVLGHIVQRNQVYFTCLVPILTPSYQFLIVDISDIGSDLDA